VGRGNESRKGESGIGVVFSSQNFLGVERKFSPPIPDFPHDRMNMQYSFLSEKNFNTTTHIKIRLKILIQPERNSLRMNERGKVNTLLHGGMA